MPESERAKFIEQYRAFDLPQRFLVDPEGRIAHVDFNVSRWMLMDVLGWSIELPEEEAGR